MIKFRNFRFVKIFQRSRDVSGCKRNTLQTKNNIVTPSITPFHLLYFKFINMHEILAAVHGHADKINTEEGFELMKPNTHSCSDNR